MAAPRRRTTPIPPSRSVRLALAGCLGGATLLGACSSRPSRSVEAYCDQARAVRDVDQVLAGGSPERTNQAVANLVVLQEVAPPEVESHVARLVTITDELAHTIGTARDPNLAANEVFARHRAELAQITEAGRAVERYTADHCQLVLNPTGSSPAGATPPPAPTTVGSTTTTKPVATTRATSPPAKAATTTKPATTKSTGITRPSTTTATTKAAKAKAATG